METSIDKWCSSGQFNIFVNSMDSGIEWTLSKFPENTDLYDAVGMLEVKDTIQRESDKHERWANANLVNSSNSKFKVMDSLTIL